MRLCQARARRMRTNACSRIAEAVRSFSWRCCRHKRPFISCTTASLRVLRILFKAIYRRKLACNDSGPKLFLKFVRIRVMIPCLDGSGTWSDGAIMALVRAWTSLEGRCIRWRSCDGVGLQTVGRRGAHLPRLGPGLGANPGGFAPLRTRPYVT